MPIKFRSQGELTLPRCSQVTMEFPTKGKNKRTTNLGFFLNGEKIGKAEFIFEQNEPLTFAWSCFSVQEKGEEKNWEYKVIIKVNGKKLKELTIKMAAADKYSAEQITVIPEEE